MAQGTYTDADLAAPAPSKAPPPSSTTFTDADVTSPAATTAKTPAPPGVFDQVADFVKEAWNTGPFAQIAAIPGQALHHEDVIDEALKSNQRLFDQAYNAYKKGDYPQAAVHGLNYLINGIVPGGGEALDTAGMDLAKGNVGKGLGAAVGLGASLSTPHLVETHALPAVNAALDARAAKATAPSAGRLSVDLIRAMPPSKTARYSPLDVQRAAPYLAAEHGASPVTSLENFIEATDSAITQIEEHVHSYIQANPTDRIRTKPLDAARQVLAAGARETDVAEGVRELQGLGLDKDLTLQAADAKRLRLNAENRAVLKKNNYDVETARTVDPGFAAREAAVEALREGIYAQLEERGIAGVADLRRDEGSLMRLRQAAEHHKFTATGEQSGTGVNTMTAKVARVAVPAVATALGAEYGGPGGAAGAGVVAHHIMQQVVPSNLTRDALVQRAFKGVRGGPSYPTVPPRSPVAGLLPSHPTELPGSSLRMQSQMRVIPAVPPDLTPQRRLAAPTDIPLPISSERLKSRMQVIEARGIVVRDPKTGRFKRVYTTEAAKGGGQ